MKLEVSHGTTLPTVIVNMKGFYEEIGIITIMNNQNISVSEHRDNPHISIYTYESDYVIYGDVDEATLLIKTMIIYFKESDYFFIKDKHKIKSLAFTQITTAVIIISPAPTIKLIR